MTTNILLRTRSSICKTTTCNSSVSRSSQWAPTSFNQSGTNPSVTLAINSPAETLMWYCWPFLGSLGLVNGRTWQVKPMPLMLSHKPEYAHPSPILAQLASMPIYCQINIVCIALPPHCVELAIHYLHGTDLVHGKSCTLGNNKGTNSFTNSFSCNAAI